MDMLVLFPLEFLANPAGKPGSVLSVLKAKDGKNGPVLAREDDGDVKARLRLEKSPPLSSCKARS